MAYKEESFFSQLTPGDQAAVREWEELFLKCDNASTEEIGTVVIPTGSRMERVWPAVNFFKQAYDTQELKPSLVITGANGSQYLLDRTTSADAPKIARAINIWGELSDEMRKEVIIEGKANNTREQAVNVYELLKENKIKSPLVLFVSAWHLPRNYMTFVGKILDEEKSNLHTKLFAVPVYGEWTEANDDNSAVPRRERTISEVKRIHIYQDKGDVATAEQLDKYVNWLRNVA